MNIHIVLLLCFLSGALCDGSPGAFTSFLGTEGEDITVRCRVQVVELGRKFFCRDECLGDDVLVQTLGVDARSGRFSLRYDSFALSASITQLKKSDSGRYRCSVRRRLLPDSHFDFQIFVVDAQTTSPQVTPPQINSLPADPVLVLVVCLPVVAVVLLTVALLLIYKKRTKHSDGLSSTGDAGSTRTQVGRYENFPPVSTRSDSTYQNLDPATRNQDQVYFTLTRTQHES